MWGVCAEELQVYMTIPFVEEAKEGEAESRFFNTVCLAGPSGEVASQLTLRPASLVIGIMCCAFLQVRAHEFLRSSIIAKRTFGTVLQLF